MLKLSGINHRASCLSFLAWALDVHVRTIVEIGVNKGETAQQLHALFPEARLYLIDPWALSVEYSLSGTPISRKGKHYESAYRHVCALFASDPRVTLLRMTALEALAHVPNNLDLVFIDANHEYFRVRENILSWLPKVRLGGLLAGHDYDPTIPIFSGVKRAVDELFGKYFILGKDRVWAHQIVAKGGTRTPTGCPTTTSK